MGKTWEIWSTKFSFQSLIRFTILYKTLLHPEMKSFQFLHSSVNSCFSIQFSPPKVFVTFSIRWARRKFTESMSMNMKFSIFAMLLLLLLSDRVTKDLLTVNPHHTVTNWSLENGYKSNVDKDNIYPYRVFGSGENL